MLAAIRVTVVLCTVRVHQGRRGAENSQRLVLGGNYLRGQGKLLGHGGTALAPAKVGMFLGPLHQGVDLHGSLAG